MKVATPEITSNNITKLTSFVFLHQITIYSRVKQTWCHAIIHQVREKKRIKFMKIGKRTSLINLLLQWEEDACHPDIYISKGSRLQLATYTTFYICCNSFNCETRSWTRNRRRAMDFFSAHYLHSFGIFHLNKSQRTHVCTRTRPNDEKEKGEKIVTSVGEWKPDRFSKMFW